MTSSQRSKSTKSGSKKSKRSRGATLSGRPLGQPVPTDSQRNEPSDQNSVDDKIMAHLENIRTLDRGRQTRIEEGNGVPLYTPSPRNEVPETEEKCGDDALLQQRRRKLQAHLSKIDTRLNTLQQEKEANLKIRERQLESLSRSGKINMKAPPKPKNVIKEATSVPYFHEYFKSHMEKKLRQGPHSKMRHSFSAGTLPPKYAISEKARPIGYTAGLTSCWGSETMSQFQLH